MASARVIQTDETLPILASVVLVIDAPAFDAEFQAEAAKEAASEA